MATITIEFDDGTVGYIEVTEPQADEISDMIEDIAGMMNLRTWREVTK